MIAATLIVRDEETHLRGCLESIAALVDDIVVVDTGSTDASRQVAADHGARVFDFKWQDDFAAARNFAIDQVQSDWILYIDADERARPLDRDALAGQLADPLLCAATVRFYYQTDSTAYWEHRLFRNDPRIRFRSAIHETIVPALREVIADGVKYIGSSFLTIDHFGYDGDQTAKHQRNLPLLLKQVREDPQRQYLWWHLGKVYQGLGQTDEAEAAWWQGVHLARANPSHWAEESLCFIEIAKLGLTNGEDATPLIQEALDFHPDNYLLQWLQARAFLAAERYADAIPVYERLATIEPETLVSDMAYNKRIFGAYALADVGYCFFKMGRYQESAESYRRSELIAPDDLEFRIKRELAISRQPSQAG